MSDYHVSRIFNNDKREIKKLDALLEKEGIQRDNNLDYTAGLYDEDYELAATGSCFGNTLRCMAVDSAHQGEGLLNQIISHLIEYQFEHGNVNLFLYTKCDKALFFRDLGFYEIARIDGKVVFMENRKNGFNSYLNHLKEETDNQLENHTAVTLEGDNRTAAGAVIMNANPFTLGHQYLLEKAAASCHILHVFVVSEDISLVPFSVRMELIRQGTSHIANLVYHETGSYMISNATFPSYFLKDEDMVIRSQALLDIVVFTHIAKTLGITRRFVGEEPFSKVTEIYNQVMSKELNRVGIDCSIIPRKTSEGSSTAISASKVRAIIKAGNIDSIKQFVPETTYRYFCSPEAAEVIEVIQKEENVIHY